ncbi:MAG: hypothetical protein K0R39_323 [Symbiobacteriaceae bacterium]|jgi:hypothetical protein|nr:hypothetical protein [Symbiobacteriaceae bacterium]
MSLVDRMCSPEFAGSAVVIARIAPFDSRSRELAGFGSGPVLASHSARSEAEAGAQNSLRHRPLFLHCARRPKGQVASSRYRVISEFHKLELSYHPSG